MEAKLATIVVHLTAVAVAWTEGQYAYLRWVRKISLPLFDSAFVAALNVMAIKVWDESRPS